MRIAEWYSHLNGLEFIQVHKPRLWTEIRRVIASVDTSNYGAEKSKRKATRGLPNALRSANESIRSAFAERNWESRNATCWITKDAKLIHKTIDLSPEKQKRKILEAGQEAIRSYNQTDFVKDRVAVEVQFGKYFAVAYDLFVKHLAFYVGDVIDVGVEIVPMKSFAASAVGERGKRTRRMSSGVPWV